MLHGGSLHIIDFQDARMGPDTYDLASLLRDSYVDISERELDELHRVLPRPQGRDRRRRGYRLQAPVRFDGPPAQPESPRHLRLPDHDAP